MRETHFLRICDRVLASNPGASLVDLATLYTTPYWQLQYELYRDSFIPRESKKRRSIIEEIVSCLLGGYGFKAELGWAAFSRLAESGLIREGVSYNEVYTALITPFTVCGRQTYYRFPQQKARYVHSFLNRSDLSSIPKDNDMALRDWLLSVKGIGLKTASWITRNYLGSDNVAIIDIHIYRAGILTGFIRPDLDISRDYYEIEKSFINYCQEINVSPSIMDIIMWSNMKHTHSIALSLINNH